jgi:hypothetical protein
MLPSSNVGLLVEVGKSSKTKCKRGKRAWSDVASVNSKRDVLQWIYSTWLT